MNHESRPAPDHALRLLRRHFLCREDQVAVLAPWGKPAPTQVDGQLDALLLAHLQGRHAPEVTVRCRTSRGEETISDRFRIGSYSPAPDGTTRWVCLDFDAGEGHADRLQDPTYTATAVWASFGAAGLPTYFERSGGGQGWHLWCFFDPPVSAAKARALAMALLPGEVELAGGERVPGVAARGIEIFPKQDRIGADGSGNMVWLPWWAGAQGAANQFHCLDEAGGPVAYAPEEFATVTAAQVDAVLARLRPDQVEAEPPPSVPLQDAEPPLNDAWREWRRQALATLPLEAIHGEWLTGKAKSGGWLECRDPWSPSGDRNPSAGVADGSGQAERGTFHSFISGKSVSVFDFMVARGEAADFADACQRVAKLSGVAMPVPDVPTVEAEAQRERPTIQVNNRQLRGIVADAWSAIHAANKPPVLFRRSAGLVRLIEEVHDRHTLLGIGTADEAVVYGLLARSADWVKLGDHGLIAVSPHRDVARDMLAYPEGRLPALEAIITTPVFSRDGELITEPGYHESERLWLHPTGRLDLRAVPQKPAAADIAAARSILLDDLLVDFPFVTESDRTHAIAALILPFVRRMISGCTPIHLVEAPNTGTGKGLLCGLISIVATGAACDARTLPTHEDEARKMITAELAKGRSIILLDNTKERRTLDCPPLSSVITAESWTDRLLGQSAMLTLPNRALWIVTGNNPRLSMETARRCIRARMDAKMDRPWRREGFKHDPITAWAQEHRQQLVHAVLVLVQAWLAAGRPLHRVRLGSFEHWSAVTGGILEVAGIPGFLGSLEQLYEASDVEGAEWREFVVAWWEAFASKPRRVAELQELCEEHDLMLAARGDGSGRSQQIKLGNALQGARDRIFDGRRITECPDPRARNRLYALVPTDADGGGEAQP